VNYKDEILNIRKQRRVSVVKLATITGIPVDRIYKWESGAGNPKAEDAEKLKNWLNNVEEIQGLTSYTWNKGFMDMGVIILFQ
jgi:DNA-binding transcriptional regulator YiaG